MIHTKLTSDVD
jgi:broad specificity phosphatase PhoE